MDILEYAAMQQEMFTAMERNEFGYETKTTFWKDFSVADCMGVESIKDTFKRAKEEWCKNRDYYTEFVIVLNHKCHYWFDHNDFVLSQLYSDLYYEADDYVWENWNEEDKEYYFKITD